MLLLSRHSHLCPYFPRFLSAKMSSKRKQANELAGDTPTKKKKDNSASTETIKSRDSDWFEKSSSKVFIGAHCSMTGGVHKAILESTSLGGQAFGLFLCNQRSWNVKPLTEAGASEFRKIRDEHGYRSHLIVPHASYLLNCGSPKEETLKKSRELMLDGVKRCEMLEIDLYNFHPGSTCGEIEKNECIDIIAESINYVHSKSNKVITVIENMSKQGHTIGGDFSEIRDIIKRVSDKTRVGVCLDTCHAFAAGNLTVIIQNNLLHIIDLGYDLSEESGFKKMMEDFDTQIGFKYLKAIHLNDSKGKVGCHLDRHENIGKGYIGLEGFRRIVNEPLFKNVPMILETPVPKDSNEIYREEIKLLYSLVAK